jgi:hypothetical protein
MRFTVLLFGLAITASALKSNVHSIYKRDAKGKKDEELLGDIIRTEEVTEEDNQKPAGQPVKKKGKKGSKKDNPDPREDAVEPEEEDEEEPDAVEPEEEEEEVKQPKGRKPEEEEEEDVEVKQPKAREVEEEREKVVEKEEEEEEREEVNEKPEPKEQRPERVEPEKADPIEVKMEKPRQTPSAPDEILPLPINVNTQVPNLAREAATIPVTTSGETRSLSGKRETVVDEDMVIASFDNSGFDTGLISGNPSDPKALEGSNTEAGLGGSPIALLASIGSIVGISFAVVLGLVINRRATKKSQVRKETKMREMDQEYGYSSPEPQAPVRVTSMSRSPVPPQRSSLSQGSISLYTEAPMAPFVLHSAPINHHLQVPMRVRPSYLPNHTMNSRPMPSNLIGLSLPVPAPSVYTTYTAGAYTDAASAYTDGASNFFKHYQETDDGSSVYAGNNYDASVYSMWTDRR